MTANRYDLLVLVQQVVAVGEGMEDEKEINVSCCLASIYVEFNNQAITIDKCEPVSWTSGMASSFWKGNCPWKLLMGDP